ncbi:MAG: hypothetical protein M3Q63_02555 [bacterium]|nr:hypothetical protein [bacterium]
MQNKIIRIALVTIGILMIPLVAMLFTSEVNWGPADFIIIGALIFGTGLAYEFIVRKIVNTTYRTVITIVLVLAFLLVWADLAVGIFNIPGISGS